MADQNSEQKLGLTPEQYRMAADIARQVREHPNALREVEMRARALQARALPLGVEGFKHFYWCLWGKELQPYAEEWVRAFASGEWTILECFRGSGKSTNLSVSFSAYCLGKEPWTSVLIVQANDDTANKTSSLIANIIEHYSGWKTVFPSIVPDKERGWGAKGYFIKDTRHPYDKWLEMCGRDHLRDPSFVGAGVSSADIVGMHPRRLIFDDIHDQTNSFFPTERKRIVEIVQANVLPVISKPGGEKPFVGVCCTPWAEDDAYQVLYDTHLFKKMRTPILRWDDNGKYELDGKRCELTWEQGFSIETVRVLRSSVSAAEFARMYLCDLNAAQTTLYRWYSYPQDRLDASWPMVGGVDYATVYLGTSSREGNLSHFALARVVKLPTGGAVVMDGIVEQCSQLEAENYVIRDQNVYPGWMTCVIESDGLGAQFIQLLQRHPNMKITPMNTKRLGLWSKEKRQYEILSPLLERAALRIADGDTPFLRTLRSYLENYPNLDKHSPEWDVADAVCMAVLGLPELNAIGALDGESEEILEEEVESIWTGITRL